MDSITKRILDHQVINEMVDKAYRDKIMVKATELDEGYFNISYLIHFDDGSKSVLKVAPSPDIQVQRYEKNLMSSEVNTMKALADMDNPLIPKIHYYDDKCLLIDSPYFLMDYMNGTSLSKLKESMSEELYESACLQMVDIMKVIHKREGDDFGFMHLSDRLYKDWYSCFYAMIEDILDDAEDVGLDLPISRKDILSFLVANEASLNEVDRPVMLHKDLWDGNIFLDEKTYEVTGIIDWERSLYGDPLLDVVCAFRQDNKGFMEAFMSTKSLTQGQRVRIKLYELYIYLLIYVEVPYRQYSDQGLVNWSEDMLKKTIAHLQAIQ